MPTLYVYCHTNHVILSSSSSGATTSIIEYFVRLNILFPIITILDAANPILYFQFLHIISYVFFPSVLWYPLWSY